MGKVIRSNEELDFSSENKEPRQEESSLEETVSRQTRSGLNLIKDAQEYLGEALVDYFEGNLNNKSWGRNLGPSMKEFITRMGPFVLKIYPAWSRSPERASQNVDIIMPNYQFLFKVLESVYGDEINNTDLIGDEPNIDEIIPSFTAATKLLAGSTKQGISVHPYILCMGLEPENRPLVAVAIREGLQSGMMRGEPFNHADRISQVSNATVPLTLLAQEAKRYGVRQLRTIIEDINSRVLDYQNMW